MLLLYKLLKQYLQVYVKARIKLSHIQELCTTLNHVHTYALYIIYVYNTYDVFAIFPNLYGFKTLLLILLLIIFSKNDFNHNFDLF